MDAVSDYGRDCLRCLTTKGVDRVVAVDLHCGQIQGFFGPRVPVDNLDGGVIGVGYFGDTDLHNPGKGERFIEGIIFPTVTVISSTFP